MSKIKDSKNEDVSTKSIILKPCFIITPIGKLNSEENIKARGLIDSVISPELEKHGFYPLPAYDIKNSGDINNQVIQNILDNELVIANLTGLNPNVMYELAIRHAARKKVIMMTEAPTVLPFDIHNQRTIFYNDSFAGSLQAKADLSDAIFATLNDDVVDNPIYKATELKSIINEDVNKPDRNLFTLSFERLDNMESAMSRSNNFSKKAIESNTDLTIYTHLTVSYKNMHKKSLLISKGFLNTGYSKKESSHPLIIQSFSIKNLGNIFFNP